MARSRGAAVASLLVLTSLSAFASGAQDTGDPVNVKLYFGSDNQKECLSFSSSIQFGGTMNWVPANSSTKGDCKQGATSLDEPYIQISFDEKQLIMFIVLDNSNNDRPTFHVGQIQYFEDDDFVYVGRPPGLKSVVNGKIQCKHPAAISMQKLKLKGSNNQTETTSVDAKPSNSSSSRAYFSRRGARSSRLLMADAAASDSPDNIQLTFTDFVLEYYSDMKLSGKPIQVDGCRYAPDLTLIIAVSGGVAGALVIGALAVALRLFSC